MKKLFLYLFFIGMFVFHTHAQQISIKAIPYVMYLHNKALGYQAVNDDHIRLIAPGHTDLFISPSGKYQKENAPMLLFQPDSSFILTTKIKVQFKTKWDAGVLLIYNDPKHYAKFCFESDFQGQPRIVTVVCNERGDDCNSMIVNNKEVYYRIVGSTKNNTFAFYYAEDGKSWFPIRTFKLDKTDHLSIGFSAQSSAGEKCAVDFEDIDFQQRKLFDRWKGD